MKRAAGTGSSRAGKTGGLTRITTCEATGRPLQASRAPARPRGGARLSAEPGGVSIKTVAECLGITEWTMGASVTSCGISTTPASQPRRKGVQSPGSVWYRYKGDPPGRGRRRRTVPMTAEDLESTARALVVPGKGILAADESHGTIGRRFASAGVANTEENRRPIVPWLSSAARIPFPGTTRARAVLSRSSAVIGTVLLRLPLPGGSPL